MAGIQIEGGLVTQHPTPWATPAGDKESLILRATVVNTNGVGGAGTFHDDSGVQDEKIGRTEREHS